MRAIERTTKLFMASVREAVPEARLSLQRSAAAHGRSNYVYIYRDGARGRTWKVRISDHAVGMRRARYGDEALFLEAGARPHRWSVWMGAFCKDWNR